MNLNGNGPVRMRPYRGRLKGAILDWAGTTVDYGSLAPVRALQELFAERGLPITEEEARRDMGGFKKDHIRSILSIPRVTAIWTHKVGRASTEDDVEGLFQDFIPMQLECLAEYSKLIPGVRAAVERMRSRGLKIGSSTGYTRPMLNLLLENAADQGFVPDCAACPDDVGAGRPFPWMSYYNAIQLRVYPFEAMVKIGDTVSDMEEGLNSRMWAVGVVATGNLIGMTEAEFKALPPAVQDERVSAGREILLEGGAHYVVSNLDEIDAVLDQIDLRLARGERP